MTAHERYDAAILGATPAGILCAVRAAREGLGVALISHEEHLGGMLSSNLRVLDTAGLARQVSHGGTDASAPLTRAEACVLVYGLLADASA